MFEDYILCVDDEAMVRLTILEQVKEKFRDEFIYEAAEDGTEALEVIEELKEDNIHNIIVVCDLSMRDMDGDEFFEIINKKFPEIIKILITGSIEYEFIEKIVEEHNIFKVIYKPWKEEDLLSAINQGRDLF